MSLTKVIQAQLPLSVHDYMQLCLQHPEFGYYRQAKAVGAEGDFITAPEVSQIFGDLIGFWLRDIWQQLGKDSVAMVELGAGRGTLSSDILRHFTPNELHIVESNETLRQAQRKTLEGHQPNWHETLETLPTDKPLFIIANEFFDALPIRQWVGDVERKVSKAFEFTPSGDVTREECPAAQTMMRAIGERMKAQGGVFLTIDYGYVEGGVGDTLQAVKNHAYANPLKDCGEVDLTSHVDFAMLTDLAEHTQCVVHGVTSQENFLRALGGDIWLQKLLNNAASDEQKKMLEDGWLRLISPTQMGTLFKVMAITPDDKLTVGGF